MANKRTARLRKRKRFDHGEPIGRIDTRPLAFVAMFLAIVFLMPASQVRPHALIVDLPIFVPEDMVTAAPFITVTIARDGQIFVDGRTLLLADVSAEIANRRIDAPTVLFRPHPEIDFGTAAVVLNEIAKAGVLPGEICFDRCRVALKSETRRVRGYFLPLIMRFHCHRAYAFRALPGDVNNRGKQTWLLIEGAQ